FEFPPNTVLVSAVYAVSLSKPLLKRLILEIQHCVDLTGQPDLSRHLKFAIAPVSTPSLPYQFSIVEGGEFSSNSWYGSIERKEFCLVCILGEESANEGGNGVPIASANGDTEEGEEEEEEQQPQQEEEEGDQEGGDDDDDSDSSSDKTGSTAPGDSRAKGQLVIAIVSVAFTLLVVSKDGEKGKEKDDTITTKATGAAAAFPLLVSETENESEVSTKDTSSDPVHKTLSTGVRKGITYAGILYYEEDRVEDLVSFTAAKKLNALTEFIKKEHSHAKIGQDLYFCFMPNCDDSPYIELMFDTPQKKPTTGWTIEPHIEPCRLYQDEVDKFGRKDCSHPSRCLISVYSSIDAVSSLHYSIPLGGVVRPKTLFIHRSLRTAPPSTSNR
uniref:Uncharacterized protein n=1 Tax=Amphimedon queenslandica TaxID=400682 RepID=A0A1X7SH43_AMPQE